MSGHSSTWPLTPGREPFKIPRSPAGPGALNQPRERDMTKRPRREDEARPLTPEELETFRELLLNKRKRIVEAAREALRSPRVDEDAIRASDEVDQASLEYEAAFEYRLRDREKFLLRKIDKALERIANGEYDECEECGEYISKRRLEARPEATLCIECKEKQERREKTFQKRRNYGLTDFEL